MPKWNDDEVRARLRELEEMTRRDARAFGTSDIEIVPVRFDHRDNRTIYPWTPTPDELARSVNQHQHNIGPLQIDPGVYNIRMEDISLVDVSSLQNQIQTLEAERAILYKHLAQQEEEIKALKAQRDSTLHHPIFKRQYK
jgi:hypothetical protein